MRCVVCGALGPHNSHKATEIVYLLVWLLSIELPREVEGAEMGLCILRGGGRGGGSEGREGGRGGREGVGKEEIAG